LDVERVILIPQGGLQLLPLHAAWHKVDGKKRYFMDDYEVTYAPSTYALDASRRRAAHSAKIALVVGVGAYDKLPPLPYIRFEANAVAALFDTAPLIDAAATLDVFKQRATGAAYLHLACHGSFAWVQGSHASALYLANDKPLTLSEIMGGLDLKSTRLVTLSACETGIIDMQQSPDEYVGLPAGFLQAGAAAVVSTLWAVDDLSTTLVMEHFYTNHLNGSAVPAALMEAQHWLRDVRAEKLAARFKAERLKPAQERLMTYKQASQAWRRFAAMDPDDRPFANPYYWAAFTFTGA
jgi:CHAT domain-containing protein